MSVFSVPSLSPSDTSVNANAASGRSVSMRPAASASQNGTTEVTEYITDESAEADQIEEDSSVDEVLSESTEESQTDSVEETVGANTWTVGDGVTASLVKEGNKDVLYLDSKGGTLRRS